MKVNKMMFLFSLIATLGLAGESGTGVGGGGEVVIINGRPKLRDRIDDTTVFCKYGTEVADEESQWDALMNSLEDLHWYMGRIYKKELEKMIFCFGRADLFHVPTEDWGSSFVYFSWRYPTEMLAVRKGDVIKVNERLFRAITPVERAETLFHELTHSFVRKPYYRDYDSEYNNNVRSFTRAISDHFEGKRKLNAKSLELQMRVFEVQITRKINELQEDKQDLQTVLVSSSSEEAKKNASIRLLNKMRAKQSNLRSYYGLLSSDAEVIEAITEPQKMLLEGIGNNDAKQVQDALDMGANPNAEPIMKAVFESIDLLSEKVITTWVDAKAFKKLNLNEIYKSHSEWVLPAINHLPTRAFDEMPDLQMVLGLYEPVCKKDKPKKNKKVSREDCFIDLTNELQGNAFWNTDDIYRVALSERFITSVRFLLSQDISRYISIENEYSETAVEVAIIKNDRDLFHQVVSSGKVLANKLSKLGNSPLHLAVLYNRIEMVKVFVESAGGVPEVKNKFGLSSIQLAKKHQLKEIVQYFKSIQ